MLLHYRTFTPFFVNLHCITIICTTIHETYALRMWIYDHYSKWQCWRVESEPHQFDYPNWFTCKPFIGVVRSYVVESQKINWIFNNIFVEWSVCLSMCISYLSFFFNDFHSCGCTCVMCYSCGLLYNPIKVLQVQVTTRIFCRPWFCCEIEKGWVPLFA